ncbi:MAG TPA: hypothetical protein VFN13_11825 [Rudaea sp.]|nr:hypothetical protein [Rudaea sp.]
MRRVWFSVALISMVVCISFAPPATADEVQSLSANINGTAFVSDDDGILLVPLRDSFTLSADTQGASAYPPPKTRIDHLAIMCRNYPPGQTFKLTASDFADSNCHVNFKQGVSNNGGLPAREYALDKSSADNTFEITQAHGKVIEGRFSFRLKDSSGNALSISEGKFKAQDRQL